MIVWGAYPPRRRPTRPVEKWNSPLAFVATVIWLVIVLWLGPWASDQDDANHPVHPAQRLGAQ